ncbi:MAG: excalibur calcium-binding domain-containing protein [Candidatus Pacebacteria bacterium]|nr:excalibur calcium-binding domain-containing protein [Candidatus Paceibacterota bacterium]
MKKIALVIILLLIVVTFSGCGSTDNNEGLNSDFDYSSEYSCSYNTYNCSDFATHKEAQRVYEACGGVNNDVHRLDRDKDGSACETLP